MARSKEKIYTERDWDAADTLDKLYMHLMEPNRWELTYEQEEKLEQLSRVWAIVSSKPTQRERIKLIIDAIPVISERTVGRLIKDAVHLFGDILKVDTDTELRLMYDRYMALGYKAENDDDFDNARRCYDSAKDILLLIESRAPVAKKVYAQVVFTSNPKALRARNADAEDADFELIDEQETGILERPATEVLIDGRTV